MAFTPNALTRNTGVTATMTAVSSLGISVSTGIIALKDDESIAFLVDVQTTQMNTLTVTLKKGNRWGSDLGDATVLVGPTSSDGYSRAAKFIGPFESYRFKDGDGKLTFTAAWETALAPASSFMGASYGQIAVFKMPNKV
jgi:hypothetical protein